jgi:hypothetical protein
MFSPDDMAERHRLMLGELAELSLSLARRLHGQALAAETPAEAERTALSFHRISRSLRQTLALEARLARDHARAGVEAERRAEETRQARTDARRRQVQGAVEGLIWTEVERSDSHEALRRLKLVLDVEAEETGFIEAPLDVLVAGVCQGIGLPVAWSGPVDLGDFDPDAAEAADEAVPLAEADLPPPAAFAVPAGAEWRSSA